MGRAGGEHRVQNGYGDSALGSSGAARAAWIKDSVAVQEFPRRAAGKRHSLFARFCLASTLPGREHESKYPV